MVDLNELEETNEAKQLELSIEEKKALIAEAKKRHGKDYLNFFKGDSGIDWQSLKFTLRQ